MSDLMLGTDGDLLLTAGDLVLNSGLEATRQRIEVSLKTFLGEWFLNADIGVPYFQQVFVNSPLPAVLHSVFKQAILSVPGVVSLQSFSLELDRQSRGVTVAFDAVTDEGRVRFNQTIQVRA